MELACSRLFLIFALTLVHLAGVANAQTAKRFTAADLFRLEELDRKFSPRVFFSPDGKWLAYVLKRPLITSPNQKTDYGDWGRGDVWVVSTTGGLPVNLTKGENHEAGFWSPVWSPNSDKLTLVSSRGGTVSLWILELSSQRLSKIPNSAINPWADINVVWISNQLLAYVSGVAGRWPQDIAAQEWSKAWEGKESTASVLESGISTVASAKPKSALVFVDVQAQTSRLVAEGDFRDLKLSPDKRYISAVERVFNAEPAKKPTTFESIMQFQPALFSVDGQRVELKKLPSSFQWDFQAGLMHWAPNGTKFTLLGRVEDRSCIVVYRIGADEPEMLTGDALIIERRGLNVRGMLWSAKSELILLAESGTPPQEGTTERRDWWLLKKPGELRNLTASMKLPPSQLVADANGTLIGPADGKLWRIFTDSKSPLEVSPRPQTKISSIVWPDNTQVSDSGSRLFDRVIVSGRDEQILYQIDLTTGKFDTITKPNIQADLVGYEPIAGHGAFAANTDMGTYLWLVTGNSRPRTVVETNTFLTDINAGDTKQIQYRGLDGQDLKAWLLLPRHYQPGKRYPMITWVYAGWVASEKPFYLANLNLSVAANMQLLAAQGYVVLFPSMPLKPEGEASDPYMELSKGVLPAVDKVIELGYTDPDRVGLIGHSYGGYSTYGLITQTNRFKAAIALAGLSDLISLYGTFIAVQRYDNSLSDTLGLVGLFERGQNRMGSPPWKDWFRYTRNSPLFYVERVETPLMIVQGDMDYIAMQQGEEFFTALYRQGKRAQFVRYWGENHLLKSPANIRDLWHRTYAWLDEFLDISRDDRGELIWDSDKVKSRGSAPPLKPEDFARFDELELHSRPQRRTH